MYFSPLMTFDWLMVKPESLQIFDLLVLPKTAEIAMPVPLRQRPAGLTDALLDLLGQVARDVGVGQTAGGMERTHTMKRIQYLVRISHDAQNDSVASAPDLPGNPPRQRARSRRRYRHIPRIAQFRLSRRPQHGAKAS